MNLSPHFTLHELTFSSTAVRLGVDNTPPADSLTALGILAHGLEEVRELLGHPMRIDSGYRCTRLNELVGGAKASAHILGYAADFVCPAFGSPLEIVRAIRDSGIAFDQCIEEGAWVHISFAPAMRRNVLTAHFGPQGATYSQGVS